MAVVEALGTGAAELTEAAIQDLKTRLRGALIVPGDAEYATARQVYNAMIDRYPRLIARCHDVADVMSAVDFGRECGLTVAVRGGGHNGGGLGIHPYSAGGAYVNMMMDEGVDRVRAAYRDNYDRLVMVKNRYDPNNLFHVNQNIKPTV